MNFRSPFFAQQPAGEEFPPSAPPPDLTREQKTNDPGVASAPPVSELDFSYQGGRPSYDEVRIWWNALSREQRDRMKVQGQRITLEQLKELRKAYQAYYPNEYYPKKVYLEGELSASDYYLIYYFFDELVGQPGQAMQSAWSWFEQDQEFIKAFSVMPPAIDGNETKPDLKNAEKWWNGLSAQQKREIEQHAQEGASNEKRAALRRRYRPYYRGYDLNYRPTYVYLIAPFDYYDYYLMSRYPWFLYGYYSYDDYLFYTGVRATVELTFLAARGIGMAAPYVANACVSGTRALFSGVQATGKFFGNIGHNALSGGSGGGSSNKKTPGEVLLGIAIIIGIIAAAASAVIGSIYTGIKTASSFANLGQGKKLTRSAWRLGCMAGGAYVGAIKGAVVGALIGSLVPGIGTAAGAVIGAIFGAPISAALAGVFAKYSAQALSWLRHGEDLEAGSASNPVVSPTNPQKWDVEKTRQALLANNVIMSTKEIWKLFTELRADKNKNKSVIGAVLGTNENRDENLCSRVADAVLSGVPTTSQNIEKNRYNKFLAAIKSGMDPRRQIRVDDHTCFMWNSRNKRIEKLAVPLPPLEGGLRL